MIELSQIKTTDTIGQLRGQLNTAFNEIQTDQPFIGRVVNPSINFYARSGTLVEAVTASFLSNQRIYALCFPESNGIFVAKVYGFLRFVIDSAVEFDHFTIDVPSIKLPTRDSPISTFVPPQHLGLDAQGSDIMLTGLAALNRNYGSMLDCTIEQNGADCNINCTNPDHATFALLSGLELNTITII